MRLPSSEELCKNQQRLGLRWGGVVWLEKNIAPPRPSPCSFLAGWGNLVRVASCASPARCIEITFDIQGCALAFAAA
jgi:hypothetical protein